LLAREVDAGHAEHRHRGEVAVEPGAGTRLVEQSGQHAHAAVLADVVRRALRATRVAEQVALLVDQCEVGLRIAAIDRQHDRHTATASSASRSSSSSDSSYCAISGW